MKRAQKEPSQWFCPSCLASAADREDFLSQEGQLKRKKPAQKKKKVRRQSSQRRRRASTGLALTARALPRRWTTATTPSIYWSNITSTWMATMPASPAGMVASRPSIDMQKGRRMSKHAK